MRLKKILLFRIGLGDFLMENCCNGDTTFDESQSANADGKGHPARATDHESVMELFRNSITGQTARYILSRFSMKSGAVASLSLRKR